MASKLPSLRDRQIGKYILLSLDHEAYNVSASIERILSLNHDTSDATTENTSNGYGPTSEPLLTESGEPIWKVLVFDNLGMSIISSILRVNDLRSKGVTIHL